jgi:hypothetical protein
MKDNVKWSISIIIAFIIVYSLFIRSLIGLIPETYGELIIRVAEIGIIAFVIKTYIIEKMLQKENVKK